MHSLQLRKLANEILCNKFLNFFIKNRLWRHAHLFVYHFTILNEQYTRYAGNTIIDGQVRILIHIYLTHIYLALILFMQGIDRWAQRKTRSAPWSPEINNGKFIRF